MRRRLLLTIGTALICALFIAASITRKGIKSTQGTTPEVSFTVLTTAYDTNAVPMYSPANFLAIWVTDTNNNFVQTIKVVGLTSPVAQDLEEWVAQTNANTVDAITTATLTDHEKHSVTWDCTDTTGTEVDDGFYRIWVEYTEEESHTAPPAGPNMYVQFEKGGIEFNVPEYSDTLFKEVSLTFTPPDATLTRIEITPDSSGVKTYSSIQFTANGYDQFDQPLAITGVTWGINTATHQISSDGLLTTLGFEGDYEITASLDGVEDKTLITIDADWVGIDEEITNNFSVFPTPALNEINIASSKSYGLCTMNLIDVTGKNVLTKEINCSEYSINKFSVGELNTGMYIIEIISDNKVVHKQKIMKR